MKARTAVTAEPEAKPPGRAETARWPLIMVVGTNLVPVGMVLWADWTVTEVVMLFWLENVIIGVYNALKIASCQPLSVAVWFFRVILLPFFIVHYGMFTLGHGVFLVSLLSEGTRAPDFSPAFIPWAVEQYQLLWPGLLLLLSHGVYFVKDYLIAGGYRTEAPPLLMFKPYGRVVVLHVGIFLMAFAVLAMHEPLLGLIAMIVLKIVIEVIILLRPAKQVQAALHQRMMPLAEFTRRWREHHQALLRKAEQEQARRQASHEQTGSGQVSCGQATERRAGKIAGEP